ncbi:hypothetical protein Sste5346_003828 [Sporothrix stenoceras]|uniref:guanylate kinase n=1 Tax=Sporothrix stenoceras TaxID=5173 RepID=A0ABR3ZCA9_9PEZI
MDTSGSTSPEPVPQTDTGATTAPGSPQQRPRDQPSIVIAGPSGVGKGILIEKLLNQHPDAFVTAISHTTRKPRDGEVAGEDYHFVERKEFEKMVELEAFVEHAEFNGEQYGTSKRAISAEGIEEDKILLLDIDVSGVDALRKIKETDEDMAHLSPRYVFIRPPSMDVLEARLRSRNKNTEVGIIWRLYTARYEMLIAESSVSGFDKVITNDDLDKALEELEEFIFEK